MKKIIFLSIAFISLVLSGCQSQSNQSSSNTEESALSDASVSQNSMDEAAVTEDAAELGTSTTVKVQDTQAASVASSSEWITSGGKYTYTGTVKNPIIIDSQEAVEITLDQVTMSMDNICIFAANGDVTLNLKGENSLENTSSEYYPYQDEKIDAVIYAKDDLLIKGSGTLALHSEMHGIVCKDRLTVNAKVDITSVKTAVRGKKGIEVSDASLTLNAGTDGLKSDSDDGTITIKNSDIQVTAKDKGLQCVHLIQIDSGTIEIDSSDDGINCDDTILVNGGRLTVTSGNDAIHADQKLTVNDGVMKLSAGEGLEAVLVTVKGGTIEIEASDDGINAAQKTGGSTPEINISGGDIKIVMAAGDTDGIDTNGNLVISGGTIDITADSPFDYDGQGSFTGGTVYVNGQQVTTLQNQMGGFRGNGGQGRRGGRGRWFGMEDDV